MQKHLDLVQSMTQPKLEASNPWLIGGVLRTQLQNVLYNKDEFKHIDDELIDFGKFCNDTLYELSVDAELNPPKLIKQDVYGNVIDKLVLSEGWRKEKEYASKCGIVAMAYENKHGVWNRLIQLLRLQMYQPVSGLFGCPLAMTDGAAYLLKQWLINPTTQCQETTSLVKQGFENLISRDPQKFWTSGQWMTEKDGGSDVNNSTTTIAIHQGGNKYKLFGYKWFSSATDSEMTLTLARIVPENKIEEFKKFPLSLFIMRVKKDDGTLNNIKIMTMKDKMGTRQLPTAELLLQGSEAFLISEEGKGVKAISHMLNVTRLYNASSAVGSMNRLYSIVLNYSLKRKAFGKILIDKPAHQAMLTKFNLNVRACSLFYFKVAQLFSKIQNNVANKDEEEMFRILTPLLKLYTAKICMYWMSEGIEALGALGYMENSYIPLMLRDAQVLTIWEGTTNVLCLDFLRALKSNDKNDPLQKLDIYARFHTHVMMTQLSADTQLPETRKSFIPYIAKMTINHNGIIAELSNILKGSVKYSEMRIRDLCFILCEAFVGGQMLELISKNGREEDILTFELWVEQMQQYTTTWSITPKAFEVLVNQNMVKSKL
ncbi:unnamed protein product [Paramecium sonneborni]|uniref:Acyl-CoA dehydrogenase n=1 Tax=Paramecium sonneborni TaxID=65129 RepID=A0A8S1NSX3_9CILI|nr:unnamed protein product [Paramecium sonneborni]